MYLYKSFDISIRNIMKQMPPKQIVKELDRYIIGQMSAKKAVAIELNGKILPKAKSTFLLNAHIIPTTNSGRDVPNAIIDKPITASEILNL